LNHKETTVQFSQTEMEHYTTFIWEETVLGHTIQVPSQVQK